MFIIKSMHLMILHFWIYLKNQHYKRKRIIFVLQNSMQSSFHCHNLIEQNNDVSEAFTFHLQIRLGNLKDY